MASSALWTEPCSLANTVFFLDLPDLSSSCVCVRQTLIVQPYGAQAVPVVLALHVTSPLTLLEMTLRGAPSPAAGMTPTPHKDLLQIFSPLDIFYNLYAAPHWENSTVRCLSLPEQINPPDMV